MWHLCWTLLQGQSTKPICIGTVFACLVLDSVLIGTESDGPSLDPCRRHERYGLGLIKDVHERFVIGEDDELSAEQILMK